MIEKTFQPTPSSNKNRDDCFSLSSRSLPSTGPRVSGAFSQEEKDPERLRDLPQNTQLGGPHTLSTEWAITTQ